MEGKKNEENKKKRQNFGQPVCCFPEHQWLLQKSPVCQKKKSMRVYFHAKMYQADFFSFFKDLSRNSKRQCNLKHFPWNVPTPSFFQRLSWPSTVYFRRLMGTSIKRGRWILFLKCILEIYEVKYPQNERIIMKLFSRELALTVGLQKWIIWKTGALGQIYFTLRLSIDMVGSFHKNFMGLSQLLHLVEEKNGVSR